MPELPVENSGVSAGAPLGVSLDTEGRTNVEFFVWSSGAASYTLWGSNDQFAWKKLKDPLFTTLGGNAHRGLNNAYRWVHLGTSNLNNNTIQIVASGAP